MHKNFRKCLNYRQPVTQFEILNGRQFEINIECSYIEKEPSSDSEAGVRSENWFLVYAKYTTLVKLTSPSIMTDLTIKYNYIKTGIR